MTVGVVRGTGARARSDQDSTGVQSVLSWSPSSRHLETRVKKYSHALRKSPRGSKEYRGNGLKPVSEGDLVSIIPVVLKYH